jgi:membrane protease YdiL (CAAX protease family)
MVLLQRALRWVVLPLPAAIDPALLAAGAGLVVIWALAIADSFAGRDGFTIIQRFFFPAAALAVWLAVFQLVPLSPFDRSAPRRPAWPAFGGFALFAGASAFIASQSGGQPWGTIAIAAASYLSLFGAAVLRRQQGGWGIAILVMVQLSAAATAFFLTTGPLATAAAPLLSILAVASLLLARRLLPRPVAPLDQLAAIVAAVRNIALPLVLSGVSGVLLALMIGGQPSALSRLLVPVAGLAASRLVAEEVFLRLWLLPVLERRFGAALALLLAAGCSAVLASVIRPFGLSPFAAAAAAFAAAFAAGVLARRTRNGPAVVVFRLLAG